MSQDAHKSSFFRQSGWMVICTVLSGIAFLLVHPLTSKVIKESEYGLFAAYLAFLNCMTIPAVGLQMVFAQQTAASVTEAQERELASTARGVLLGILSLWFVAFLGILIFQNAILTNLKISNPAGLWIMLSVALVAMWSPVFAGILQGRQNFLWMGWGMILNSIGRLGLTALVVLVFAAQATGISVAILLGTLSCMLLYGWFSQATWRAPGGEVKWKQWLGRVVPLTFGFGSFQFLLFADPLFVKWWFSEDQAAPYMAAGTLARALCTFTAPIVAVMFPMIVRSAALSHRTNVMKLTLVATAALASAGALCLTLIAKFAPGLLVLVFKDTYRDATLLLPWFAWSMVPLAVANVMLNNLLAHNHFKVVPWAVVVAVGYVVALTQNHGTFVSVLQTLGVFNLVLLAVVGFFTWRQPRPVAQPCPEPAAR